MTRHQSILREVGSEIDSLAITGDTPLGEVVDALESNVKAIVDSFLDEPSVCRKKLIEIAALAETLVVAIDLQSEAEYFARRRMWYIIGDTVKYAPFDDARSHSQWMEAEGDLESFNEAIRGHVDETGLYAYKGTDFLLSESDCEQLGFHLAQLVLELGLDGELEVWGGVVSGRPGHPWQGRNKLGRVRELLGW